MSQQEFNWHDLKTNHGYNLAECASAFQKAIRRSDVDGAVYWAAEIATSGKSKYVWKRLFVILNEDVDPQSNPGLVADVWALFQMVEHYKKEAKAYGKNAEVENLALTQAVIKVAVAKKSRVGVHATITHFNMPKDMRPIPDHALDRHTIQGKRMGRNWDFFFDVASVLENIDGTRVEPDPYEAGVREWLQAGEPHKQGSPPPPAPKYKNAPPLFSTDPADEVPF